MVLWKVTHLAENNSFNVHLIGWNYGNNDLSSNVIRIGGRT